MEHTHLDPTRPPAAPAPGDSLGELRTLGEYRLLRRLGEGGMGTVYLGYLERQDQQIAIKVLGDHLASNQTYIDRFYREAKSGALLDHPNIVRTLNVGQDRTTAKYYLVLEFIDGPSARALLEHSGRLPVGDAVHIALSIARALEHAHSRNVVHRDIKPDNILITRAGVVKLADLSLARRTDEASHLTAARQGFGTTHYMPYEQAINAKSADGRSDIYALGATLYHLVTGSVPFPGENHLEVVEKKCQGKFAPASSLNPQVPAVLDQILARMLARHPRDRYQTASELIIDLERSRLAPALPTFADPERARQDPWVQALASETEPTRLDPESLARSGPGPRNGEAANLWLLRYQDRGGRILRVRATTEQILRRLRRGQLPETLEVRRLSDQDGFHPVSFFTEFQSVLTTEENGSAKAPPDKDERNGTSASKPAEAAPRPKVRRPRPRSVPPAPAPTAAPWYRRLWALWLGTGTLLLLLALLGLYSWLHRP
jgi:serine/threonine protein kinase